jgi:hypothetical protein
MTAIGLALVLAGSHDTGQTDTLKTSASASAVHAFRIGGSITVVSRQIVTQT